jgi:phospholipid/cholesterol/gamma-HCH transport system substrate-binding protein
MSMHKLIKPLAYLTALVMIAAGVLLFWPDDGKKDTYAVTAYFEKGIGLFPNSDVNILGVPVGKIRTVEPVGERVKVTMEVSRDYKIPADATAQIVPISLISDRYVEFAPAYTGGPVLQDGSVIPEDRTVIPAELDDVFKQLKKLLDAIQPGGPGEPGALGELIVELDETFQGREDDLQGALTEGAQLTRTLAGTKEDLQGLLANLDTLFAKLATRSGDFDTLNENLITVLTAITESRDDLEGTLVNLGDLSAEVTDLAHTQGGILEKDLRRLARIVKVVLKNEPSVRQSLSWLPVLGFGLNNAYNPVSKAVDVRDNANAKMECEILNEIPELIPEQIRDLLKDICAEETGEPGGGGLPEPPIQPPAPDAAPEIPDEPQLRINCSEGVKRVKRQLRRIEKLGLPNDVKQELLDPLRKRLKELGEECDKLADKVQEETDDLLDELLDEAPDVGGLPDVQDTLDGLTGNASGATRAAPPAPPADADKGWFENFMGFLGL